MIYDVKSEYYGQFLSTKNAPSQSKSKPSASTPAVSKPDPDAMDTED